MTSKTSILKLQQNESKSNINDNGSYEIELENPIIMEAGDVLSLKSCFLDTTASSSGKIQVDKDTPLRMSVGKYIKNFNIDLPIKTLYPALAAKNDADNYILGDTTTHGVVTAKLQLVEVKPRSNKHKTYGSKSSKHDLALPFQYINNAGKTVPFILNMRQEPTKRKPRVAWAAESDINQDPLPFPMPLITEPYGKTEIEMMANSFIYTGTDKFLEDHNISGDISVQQGAPTGTGNSTVTVRESTFNYVLPAGEYAPDELSTLLNSNMVQIDNLGGAIGEDDANRVFPVSNPFISTLKQELYQQQSEGQVVQNWIKEDGTRVMQFDLSSPANDRFVGANQVALEYDKDIQKLMFSSIHLPVYVGDADGAVPGCLFDSSTIINKYSGVFFTELHPVEFWFNKLGFSPSILNHGSKSGLNIAADGVDTATFLMKSDLIDGVNMTGALKSIDLPIQKTTDFNKVPQSTNTAITTNYTTPIYSNRIFDDPSAKSGYFLIEINGLPNQQDFRGSVNSLNNSNNNKIHGIITRYYATDSFTMDEGQGAIQYEHTGASAVISNLGIKITDSDGNIPAEGELGPQNTVFLEVIKNRNGIRKDTLDYSNY